MEENEGYGEPSSTASEAERTESVFGSRPITAKNGISVLPIPQEFD